MKVWQKGGASDATICRRVAALRSFYNFMFIAGYVKTRPTSINYAFPLKTPRRAK